MRTTKGAAGEDHGGGVCREKTVIPTGRCRTVRASLRIIASGLALLWATGCARVPTVRAPAADSAAAPAARSPVPAVSSSSAETAIDITSAPAGATILVNDRPSGKAPLRLAVKTTPQGFCADYLTIKARFIASDASEVSQTTEADLTPRDKAPRELVFTPQGVQRHLR